jgi:HK97 family phage major capsid protein
MTTQVLEKLCDERDEVRSAAIAIAESESFDPEDATFVDLQTRATELDKRVASLTSLIEQRSAADALDGKFAKAHQRQEQERSPVTTQTRQSWGEAWIRSEEAQSYRMKGSSGVVTVDDDIQTRALPTGITDLVAAGMHGAITQVDTTPPVAPTPLLDSVTSVQVSGNAVEYVSWAKTAGGAATVAEKAAKPSVEYKPTVTPATLEMIAVYTQLTRQLMEDAPAVRSLIDGELRREIAREEEEHAAAAIAAATLPTASGDDLLSAIRVGIGTVQAAGYSPSAIVLNPADYADMDIAVMGATLLGPTVRQSFWGLTPVPVSSQPAGTAIVGDMRTAVQRFYRSQISLFVTDSHADTFLSNVFTLLAERRSLTAVVKPQALVEVSAG